MLKGCFSRQIRFFVCTFRFLQTSIVILCQIKVKQGANITISSTTRQRSAHSLAMPELLVCVHDVFVFGWYPIMSKLTRIFSTLQHKPIPLISHPTAFSNNRPSPLLSPPHPPYSAHTIPPTQPTPSPLLSPHYPPT